MRQEDIDKLEELKAPKAPCGVFTWIMDEHLESCIECGNLIVIKRLEAENKALRKSEQELRALVKKSFVDGYNAGEDHYQKDDAWRYSWTKNKLEAITGNEYEGIEW